MASCRSVFIILFLVSGRFSDAQSSVCVLKTKASRVLACQIPVFKEFWCPLIFLLDSYIKTVQFPWLLDSRYISFDAAFPKLSKDQQERQQRAASQQQSHLITVRAISKNPDEGYKDLSLQKRFHYSFFSLPFLCLAKKRNKGGTLLTEN